MTPFSLNRIATAAETAPVSVPALTPADHPVKPPDFPEAKEDPEQSAELELQQDA
jgi:hypothetical protein